MSNIGQKELFSFEDDNEIIEEKMTVKTPEKKVFLVVAKSHTTTVEFTEVKSTYGKKQFRIRVMRQKKDKKSLSLWITGWTTAFLPTRFAL
jgi:hypothetical protein